MNSDLKNEHEENKKCIRCGATLAAGSHFCPSCEAKQITDMQSYKRKRMLPLRMIRALQVLSALFVLLTGFVLFWQHTAIQTKESVRYTIDGETYDLAVSFFVRKLAEGEALGSLTDRLPYGHNSMIPSVFAAFKDGENRTQEFLDKTQSFSVTCVPRNGAKAMEAGQPEDYVYEDSHFLMSWLQYNTQTETNEIIWQFQMKNGDSIRLKHTMTCEQKKLLEYHYEDTPLSTTEEIMALLSHIKQSEESDAIVMLYLAPIEYTGDLTIDERTAYLIGSNEGGKKTVFSGTVKVITRVPDQMQFVDIDFSGDGGTGLLTHEAVQLNNCRFSGWDVGLDCQEGSWPGLESCTFSENGIGFRFNSNHSTATTFEYHNLVFQRNRIGAQILKIPAGQPSFSGLTFFNTVFEDNEVDLEDPEGRVSLVEE